MLAWNISDVNWSSTDTSSGRMEARVVMHGLEHIPIWDDIEVLGKQRVVRICEDVPWMAGWDFREEVVRVSDEKRWLVLWHLRVEEYLRRLRHTGYGFHVEVTEGRDGPGVEIGWDEIAASLRGDESVEHKLCTANYQTRILGIAGKYLLCLDGINSTSRKKTIEIIVKPRDVLFRNRSQFTTKRQVSSLGILSNYINGLVGLSDLAVWCKTSPVAQDCMPHRNVLNAWMLLPNTRNSVLQAIGKSFSLSFEFDPSMLKLPVTSIID